MDPPHHHSNNVVKKEEELNDKLIGFNGDGRIHTNGKIPWNQLNITFGIPSSSLFYPPLSLSINRTRLLVCGFAIVDRFNVTTIEMRSIVTVIMIVLFATYKVNILVLFLRTKDFILNIHKNILRLLLFFHSFNCAPTRIILIYEFRSHWMLIHICVPRQKDHHSTMQFANGLNRQTDTHALALSLSLPRLTTLSKSYFHQFSA